MSYFWASFEKIDENIYRYDTRIYLSDIESINSNDLCIAAVVGINPGSAKANDIYTLGLQKINLDGDKLLPTVRNIFLKAYNEAKEEIPKNGYIQVLNLFYLCDENKEEAIRKINNLSEFKTDKLENKEFNLIWYLWGQEDERINFLKNRFKNINSKHHIFYNQIEKQISFNKPDIKSFARHTRGLAHSLIVPSIASILKKLYNNAPLNQNKFEVFKFILTI